MARKRGTAFDAAGWGTCCIGAVRLPGGKSAGHADVWRTTGHRAKEWSRRLGLAAIGPCFRGTGCRCASVRREEE